MEKNSRGGGIDLKPCPFCGFKPDPEDDDCIYPAAQKRDESGRFLLWQVVCYETGGGCSASVLGDSAEDAAKNWNKRNHRALKMAIDEAVRRQVCEKEKKHV